MIASLTFNRRHGYRIFESSRGRSQTRTPLSRDISQESSPSGSFIDTEPINAADSIDPITGNPRYPAKKRNCCGLIIRTPNSSRFADNWHSRVLQKFPFLIEMFYWVANLAFYAVTKAVAQVLFSKNDGLKQLAENHGLLILDIEQNSWFKWFFFIREVDFQAFFLNGHLTAMTFLNRIYSLVHIPGTVAYVVMFPNTTGNPLGLHELTYLSVFFPGTTIPHQTMPPSQSSVAP